jgi:uncharacterized protein (DUF2252 family)
MIPLRNERKRDGSKRGIPHQQVEHHRHRHAVEDRDALGLGQPTRRTPLRFLIVPDAYNSAGSDSLPVDNGS